MFKKVTSDVLTDFRLIYHQTTGYSNPIIESVLYQNRKGCDMYYWGDLIDGNYLIFHRSGFSHINLNPFDKSINQNFFKELDNFMEKNSEVPEYLLFYHAPKNLINYWKKQKKKHFKIRRRRRYQIDENFIMTLDESHFSPPANHELRSLHDCPYDDLASFNLSLESKFYDSKEEFLSKSYGFVLYNENKKPTSLIFLICLVGRNGEHSVTTLPEFRNKGYGHLVTINCVRESIARKINFGWDVFVENHSNNWAQKNNYGKIIHEYDLISFLK